MSKQKTVPLWRKILWRGVVFPVFALGILAAGSVAYLGGITGGDSNTVHNVVVLDASNAKSTQAQMQAAAQSGKLVFMEICDGEFCAGQTAELDKVAEKYKDKVFFVQVKPSQVAPLLPKIAQLTGGRLAFPMHFIDTGKMPLVDVGIKTADELDKMVEVALKVKSGEIQIQSAPSSDDTAPANKDGDASAKPETPAKKDDGALPATTTSPNGK